MNIPAISVVIPIYNTERYVGECLDSILAQTFTDFEVIVVDDCSTDNSVAVVESYAEKFGGRLRIAKMLKKSGGGGSFPRNIGVELSRGKYIYFMDSDDAVKPSALAELFEIAEKFQADVVHCEKFYMVPDKIWHDEKSRAKLKADNHFTEERLNVTAPTLLSDNIVNRIKIFAERRLIWNYWAQLVRRDFVVENSIKLPDAAAQDMIWTICELCSAKRYIVVPNAVYYYRVRENSVSTEQITDAERMHKWLKVIKAGVKCIDEFFSSREKLSGRTDLKYVLFEVFVKQMIEGMDLVYQNSPAFKLDEILRKEFGGGDNLALEAFVFNAMNVYRLKLEKNQEQLSKLIKFSAKAQKRIAELEAELKRRQP